VVAQSKIIGGDQSGKSHVALRFAVNARRSGDRIKAQMLLRDRLVQDPSDANALTMLADMAIEDKRIEEATVLLRRAADADASPQRRIALIEHLHQNSFPALALKELEALPAEARDSFQVSALAAKVFGKLGLHDRQIGAYERMLKQEPKKPGIWMNLANALKTVGRTDEAVKALKRATTIRPSLGQAHWALANFKSYKFTPQDISKMLQALRGEVNHEEALNIHFALGKAYEDRGDHKASFRHYSAGNALRSRQIDPADASITGTVDSVIEHCTPKLFKRPGVIGCQTRGPIFVFGLHRSGSTLVEQILASHPQIEGTAELSILSTITSRLRRISGQGLGETLSSLSPKQLGEIGEEYLNLARPFRHTDKPLFVDKMPGNWIYAPLIRLALPNAIMIDARRSPMACGFSNFKQNYATGVAFSYSLRGIGEFYRDYWRFMRHFDAVQPGAVHRVLNERLIDDPEGEVRRMLDFIGLPFAQACLEFHDNRRAVRTPSAEQVRRPINRDGVDQWRNYEPWLDELKTALGPALENWAT
jgi:tetratricopeptide (TPR) repeat protein